MATLRLDTEPLHVTSAEIQEHIGWDVAIEAARAGALAAVDGDILTRRTTLPLDGGWMRLMAASVRSMGVFGYKEFHLTSNGSLRYAVHLFDTATGSPVGIVDAALVTTLRTAATAAVALEHIFGTGAPLKVAVVGSGAESLAGVGALASILRLDEVTVTSRSPENRDAFVAKVAEQVGLQVTPHATVADAVAGADLVYSATNSGGRVVLQADEVAAVPVIATIGSTLPVQREVAGRVFTAAQRVIVDTPEVFEESGDALEAVSLGFDASTAESLGSALRSGVEPDRSRRTVYKSIGSPDQDVVLAATILRLANEAGFGRRITPLSAIKVNL